MLDRLTALSETAESIGSGKCAAELTVQDMLVLAEVAVVPDPGLRRKAAREALTCARRASCDSTAPDWVTPATWAPGQRTVPSYGRARRVRDCDGRLWERRHTVEDGDAFEIDAWSPAVRRDGVPHLIHGWDELITHYGPLTEVSSQSWPQQPPVPDAASGQS